MTAKQKAKELWTKHENICVTQSKIGRKQQAKLHALLNVEEIINSTPLRNGIQYWIDVKYEIEQL